MQGKNIENQVTNSVKMPESELEKLLLDNTCSLCFITDVDTMEVLYINKRFREVLKIENLVLDNHKCYELLQGRNSVCENCNVEEKNEELILEYNNQDLDTFARFREKFFEYKGRNLKVSSGYQFKTTYINLESGDTISGLLEQCLDILSVDSGITESIDKLLSLIGEFYKGERVGVFEFDESKQYTSNTYEWHTDGLDSHQDWLQKIPVSVISYSFDRLVNDGYIFLDDINKLDNESSIYKILSMIGVKDLLAVPLKVNGSLVGGLTISNPGMNKQNIKLLQAVSVFILDGLNKINTNKRLETLLNQDRLTGLYNRHYFDQNINQIKSQHVNNVGIIYIDVNGLKKMNDNFGHSFGDVYIENCANFIKRHFPNCAHRIGGDEFVVIIKNIDEKTFNEKVEAFIAEIKEDKKVSMSLGAVWCESYININLAIKEADKLMYKNKIEYYENIGDYEEYFARNVIDMLQKDVDGQDVKVLFQPKIDIKTKRFVGAEAFLYKVDFNGEYVPSSIFMAEFESLGNMNLLDLYVLERCCVLLNMMDEDNKDEALSQISISMKFSQQTILTNDIHIECKEICDKLNVDTHRITIEVSEDSGFVESKEIFNKLQLFREQGFKLSIENYGETNNKKEILDNSFDKVKLNKNLLIGANVNETKYAILEHLIKNYQTVSNVEIIVNGIEEEEHMLFLECYDGIIGQGNLISKPLMKSELLEYIKQNKGN